MTAVIVGASAGLGRALAVELAARGRSLLLVASDGRDLEAIAADLAIRFGTEATTLACDAADAGALAASLRTACTGRGEIEALLLPLGAVDDGDEPLLESVRAERLVAVNLLAICAAVREIAPWMIARRTGTIVGFGSIAAIRGRTQNSIYAAAKRGLESYFESLRHALEPSGVCVSFYALGYVDTALAYGRPLLLPKADPDAIARAVCGRLGRHPGRHFMPWFWRPVGLVLRALPWAAYRRLRL